MTRSPGRERYRHDVRADRPIRVLLLDDHDIVRVGLVDLIDGESDLKVTVSVGSIAEATTAMEQQLVDVAVVDVRLNGESGLDFCALASRRWPTIRSIVLTADDGEQTAIDAATAGAWALLTKQIRGDRIPTTIRQVAAGKRFLSDARVAELQRRVANTDAGRVATLSDREHEIFELIGAGASNREIAERLFIAEKTVKNQITGLLAKLHLSRRTEVAALAARVDERTRRS